MAENLDSALQSMRMKPVQMALMTLGYNHDMAVTDKGMELIIRRPGLTVNFNLDEVTLCIVADFMWHAYVPAKKQAEYLRAVNDFNRPTRDLQVVLDEVDPKNLTVRGREFFFSGVGATWEQSAEFVHYCMTEVAETFVSWCEQTWPKFAPERTEFNVTPPAVDFEFSKEQLVEGNPFGLIDEPTPLVTLERIHQQYESLGADELKLGEGFVEYQHMGQRVSAWLTDGNNGSDRQTLAVSSGTGVKIKNKKQLEQLLALCNLYSREHMLVTVFTEEIENGARSGIFAEARIDLPAGLNDQQLWAFLANTSKWTAEVCLTVAYRLQDKV
ncbi:hypothetical protein N24_2506 [Corynebacterium suranareeae]|uniref:Uncharacterized protein n=1 Tax=Corynebacterium suranareeae TaxID=2506452 RepID=A0A161JP18_9CORY|nr:hypothetical protein [Corynebacterium suranareeae]BAU96768.1 hypothetical protein N24_2506 [Corynebacterium suranareeae]